MKLRYLQSDLLIAISSGIWIYLLLLLLGPFDVHDVSFSNRSYMMIGYGVIFSVSYYLAALIHTHLCKLTNLVERYQELLLIGLVFCGGFLPTFTYYKSEIILGESNLLSFLITMYAPLSFLLLSGIYFIRRKVKTRESSSKIILQGKGKHEVLQLALEDLIAIKSANNYIEVHYLVLGSKETKLLRQSLKNLRTQVPQLIQTHRSHLINPAHITFWKNRHTLNLQGVEVPVSEAFKEILIRRMNE